MLGRENHQQDTKDKDFEKLDGLEGSQRLRWQERERLLAVQTESSDPNEVQTSSELSQRVRKQLKG